MSWGGPYSGERSLCGLRSARGAGGRCALPRAAQRLEPVGPILWVAHCIKRCHRRGARGCQGAWRSLWLRTRRIPPP